MQTCQMEQSLEKFVNHLDTLSSSKKDDMVNQLMQVPKFAEMVSTMSQQKDGVYRVQNGQITPLQSTFAETVQLGDMKSGHSIVGEIIGMSLVTTVGGILSRFVPVAGIPIGVAVAVAAYLASTRIGMFKNGIGHAVARGLIIGGGATVIGGTIQSVFAGLTNGMGGT